MALGVALFNAGYKVSEIVAGSSGSSRKAAAALARRVHAKVSSSPAEALDADVVWFCVPDRNIAQAARDLGASGNWKGKVALHSSGALASDELDALRRRGASVASAHPLMTFANRTAPVLRGVPFALEGDVKARSVAKRLAVKLGGSPFAISKRHKLAYHAWGTFASPLVIALLATAEQVAEAGGVSARKARRMMAPILRQTVQNYCNLGAAAAFSGPFVRGDAAIVRKHLDTLRNLPEAQAVYATLAEAAIRYLPSQDRSAVTEALKRK